MARRSRRVGIRHCRLLGVWTRPSRGFRHDCEPNSMAGYVYTKFKEEHFTAIKAHDVGANVSCFCLHYRYPWDL